MASRCTCRALRAAAAPCSCTPGDDEARSLAKETIAALEDYEHVVVNAAGCGSAMKDYGHLFRDDPDWSERAERFSDKVKDATELLAEAGPRAERHPLPVKLAYHDACHLSHAQGVRSQPRELLRGIPELELVEPAEWEICCGSAGIYNLVKPEPAAELGERKARNLLDTGRRGDRRGEPRLRAADRRAQRAPGPAPDRAAPDGAARPINPRRRPKWPALTFRAWRSAGTRASASRRS